MKLNITLSHALLINVAEIKKQNLILFKNLKAAFTYKNPKFLDNLKWGYSNYNVPKHLFSYAIDEGTMYIARGGLDLVLKECKKFKVIPNIIDRTLVCDPVDFNHSRVKRRPDQEKFISALLKHDQGCGIAYTSFGKTLSLLELAKEIRQPTLVIVHTTFLQQQWIEEATNPETFNMNPKHIGGVGGVFGSSKTFKEALGQNLKYEKRKLGKLNICLYHSLMNNDHLKFFKDDIGLVLFDEGQKSPIEGVQEVVNKFRARYRYAASAELKRKDGKEFLTYDTFGPVRYRAKETNSDSKIICNIQLVPTKYNDLTYSEDNDFSGLLTRMGRDQPRNILICKRVLARVKRGETCIIFVQRKEQAGILAKMLSKFKVEMLTGGMVKSDIDVIKSPSVRKILSDYDHKTAYKRIKALAEEKKIQIVIGSQKAEVGLSVRAFNYGLVTTPMGNEERFKQIKGRIERTYSKEQEEMFGPKPVPLLEVLVDPGLNPSTLAADTIKEIYGNRVKRVKLKPKTKLRRKSEKAK